MIWSYYTDDLAIMDSKYKDEFQKIFKWIKNNNLKDIEYGKYVIEGDDLFVNVFEYETKNEDKCIWEAHKRYLDLHLIISGTEEIGLSVIKNMKIGFYEKESDYLHINGEADAKIICKEGSMLLLYPSDVHKTAIKVNKTENIKKAVFKIRIHV